MSDLIVTMYVNGEAHQIPIKEPLKRGDRIVVRDGKVFIERCENGDSTLELSNKI